MGLDAMIFIFWKLGFKPAFSLSSFTFIKRLFSYSSFSPIGWCHLLVWGYWYFSWQSWFQLVLPPAQHFTWYTLHRSRCFLEFSCFFYDTMHAGNFISGSSAFSKSSLNIWMFSVHIVQKPSLENFQYYFARGWDDCNCAVVWTFFGIAFFRDWNESWPFPVLWPLLSFPNLLVY